MTEPYEPTQPSREDIERQTGPAVLQFGTNWCGYCTAAEPLIERVLAERPQLPRTKVEDGQGRVLGRFFKVTLWPTLVFLQDGREVARVVRPHSEQELRAALGQLR